jgi:NAD(P)-dependent dehydrogenase (short-subunit alcohol dehydrogenase family)
VANKCVDGKVIVVTGAGRGIGREISLLAASDREQLLVAWNRTAAPVNTDISIEGLFEAQAERTPDAVAIRLSSKRRPG